jgi:hypothetical protein
MKILGLGLLIRSLKFCWLFNNSLCTAEVRLVSRSKIIKGEVDKIGKDAIVDSYVGPKKTAYPIPKLEPGAFRIQTNRVTA